MKVLSKKYFILLILVIFFVGMNPLFSAKLIESDNYCEGMDEEEHVKKNIEKIPSIRKNDSILNLEKLNLFENLKLKDFRIYTKWIDENKEIHEKSTMMSGSGGKADVNDDGISDVEILFSFGLKIILIKDFEFTDLNIPYVLGFVTEVEITRTSNGCIKEYDFFEIHSQVRYPSFLGLEQKVFNIGGYRSNTGEKTPETFRTSHKYIPYFIRNLLGLRNAPEFWVDQDPGEIDGSSIDYLVGLTEMESNEDSSLYLVVENRPAKSFDLKFKMGLEDNFRLKFNSREGIFENLSFSLVHEKNNKKICGSFVFNDISKVEFDSDLNVNEEKATVSYFSRDNIDFEFRFFNEFKDSLFKTGVLWERDKSFTAEIKYDSSFTIEADRFFELYDISFKKPGLNFKLDSLSSKKSGSCSFNLINSCFNISSDIELDLTGLSFNGNNFSVNIGTIKPSWYGFFSLCLEEDKRGFKIGGDVGLFIDDVTFESLKDNISIEMSGGIDIESDGWVQIYKTSDDINHVKLKLSSTSFEFSNVDFIFNGNNINVCGLFNFENKRERIFHVQWKKPDVFKFEFDKDVRLIVSDFYVSTNLGWTLDHVKIDSFSWINGRHFCIELADNGLTIETSISLNMNNFSLVFKNGVEISSDDAFFEGALEVEWAEEQLFIGVESNIDWDLTVDTPNFGAWTMKGLLEGNVQINSEWQSGKSGTLEFVTGSNGVLHDFFIEHEDLELHLGTFNLSTGSILFDWKRGNNGYLEMDNDGITASLDFCSILHPPSLFSFEVGTISLIPGYTVISWENTTNLIHLNLNSGIIFDIAFVKLTQEDTVLKLTGLDIQPGIFDFKCYKIDNKMEFKNGISGFGPKVSIQKNNEIFKVSLFDISTNEKTTTLEWYKDGDTITGFSVDTSGSKFAKWIECLYKKGDNYGRKLAIYNIKADGFTIRNQGSTVYLNGKIDGSRLVYHNYLNGNWHMLSDTRWNVNGDGQGYFSMECDPDWNLEVSPLILWSEYNVQIDSTVYAPSFFNLTWDFGFGPLHAFIGLDTDGETIGNIVMDIHDSWWNVIIDGSTLAAENFWIYWEIFQGIETGGTIYTNSTLSIELFINGEKLFSFEYPP